MHLLGLIVTERFLRVAFVLPIADACYLMINHVMEINTAQTLNAAEVLKQDATKEVQCAQLVENKGR